MVRCVASSYPIEKKLKKWHVVPWNPFLRIFYLVSAETDWSGSASLLNDWIWGMKELSCGTEEWWYHIHVLDFIIIWYVGTCMAQGINKSHMIIWYVVCGHVRDAGYQHIEDWPPDTRGPCMYLVHRNVIFDLSRSQLYLLWSAGMLVALVRKSNRH
jgi:hypothetical protein